MKIKVCNSCMKLKSTDKFKSVHCECGKEVDVKVISMGDYSKFTGKPNNKPDFTKLVLETTKSF